jgi:predicted MFS family arabinose efflux permease
MMAEIAKPCSTSAFRPASLDAVNFLLADVRGSLGPYLNVFLVTQQHWSQSAVGLVTALDGLLGLVLKTPIGAAIDSTHAKRGMIVAALAAMAISAATIAAGPSFWPVLMANSLMAIAGDVLGPAAITLGLSSSRRTWPAAWGETLPSITRATWRLLLSRAVLAGLSASAPYSSSRRSSRRSPLPQCCLSRLAPSTTSGHAGRNQDKVLRKGCPFGRSSLNVSLSWFSRAAPCCSISLMRRSLIGQKLAQANPQYATAMMSSCIIAAQLVMLPIALFVGRTADLLGRKPILLAGFAILPIRAVLYTLSDDSAWLIAVQLLDGIGAGIFGALTPLLLADLMRGTGRYNLAQGAIGTAQGIGASSSGLAAGIIVDHLGYSAAFLTAGGVASVALILLVIAMPETARTAANRVRACGRPQDSEPDRPQHAIAGASPCRLGD